ncbi:MAG: ATP-binding cassette domain-containing protein [Anaerolineales bacterium]|nr:ATP-binding cassette domain-containing protein [Anaerolineales bacterium]
MSGYRLAYLTAAVSLGIAAILRTGNYLLVRYLVDDILLGDQAIQYLILVALGFIVLALLQGTFIYLSGRMAAKTSEGIAQRIRNYLFNHIQRLPFSYHDMTPTGELIQRSTSDVDAIRRFFNDQAIGFGRILLLFIVNFTALLIINWQLALLSTIAVPFIVIISFFFFRSVSARYEEYQKQEAKLSTTLQENLTGVRVVKAFARQTYEIDKFEQDNWEKFLRGKRLLFMHSLYWPFSDIIAGFQMIAGFAIGAIMAINGTITVGTYMAYAGIVIWIIWPMRGLGRLIVQMSSGIVSYNRLIEVIEVDEEPIEEGLSIPDEEVLGKIVFDQVCFEYDENSPVLQDISFRCDSGQSIALLGPTGSGKTTLVNLLARFYDYTGGSITLDGIELKDYSREFLRKHIGIVEQEPFLFSRTIRENITYGVKREVSDEEVEEAARAAAIHDVILTFPGRYNTLVGEKGVTLSGGQKQRIAIARALLRDPRVLILDDSTSSVDMETEAIIRSALYRLMQGRTSFIIAHRIQSVQNADHILVLDKGRIVQSGTHEELMEEDAIYRQVYDLQTQIDVELEKEIGSV